MLLAEQDVIGPEHLPPDVVPAPRRTGRPFRPHDSGPPWPLRSLEDLEREHVAAVLAAMRGSREEAARVLGISRRTLTRMIQRWDLPRRLSAGQSVSRRDRLARHDRTHPAPSTVSSPIDTR